MELEELKLFWVSAPELNAPKPHRNLADILLNTSGTTLHKLQRSIRFEIAACFIFLLLSGTIALSATTDFLKLIAIAASIYGIVFGAYLLQLKKQLEEFQLHVPATLTALRNTKNLLKRFLQLYFHCCMLCGPLVCITALFFFFQEHPGFQQHPAELLGSTPFLVYCLAIVCWTIFLYFFTRWWLHQSYGQHLRIIEQELADLEKAS